MTRVITKFDLIYPFLKSNNKTENEPFYPCLVCKQNTCSDHRQLCGKTVCLNDPYTEDDDDIVINLPSITLPNIGNQKTDKEIICLNSSSTDSIEFTEEQKTPPKSSVSEETKNIRTKVIQTFKDTAFELQSKLKPNIEKAAKNIDSKWHSECKSLLEEEAKTIQHLKDTALKLESGFKTIIEEEYRPIIEENNVSQKTVNDDIIQESSSTESIDPPLAQKTPEKKITQDSNSFEYPLTQKTPEKNDDPLVHPKSNKFSRNGPIQPIEFSPYIFASIKQQKEKEAYKYLWRKKRKIENDIKDKTKDLETINYLISLNETASNKK